MSERRTIFEIAAVYTAVIIGAGFATGRELISFFLNYGDFAVAGMLLSGVLMALVGWATLEICARNRLTGFDALLGYAAGPYVGAFIKAGAVAFLFVIFAAMLSAAGALGAQLFGLPNFAGALVLAVLCYAAFAFDLRGLVRINTFLAPVMIAGSIGLGLYTYFADAAGVFDAAGSALRRNWAGSALIYASYNMIAAISILAAMSTSVRTRRAAFWGTALGSGAVTLIALSLALGLSRGLGVVDGFQVPFLRLVQDYGPLLQWAYVAVLSAAVYTTAISNGYCFYIATLQKAHANASPWVAKAAICGAALAFSQIEFTRIVESVYPIFGLVGLLLAAILIITMLTRAD
ncbi:MAG: hypothetical protein FWD96_07145 [Defluviitaleaceae bacterium]|nr:hypothetical protein [Defluviitaleaceae bacterium]